MQRAVLHIDGMTCVSCSSTVERHLRKQDAVSEAHVNLLHHEAVVTFDAKKMTAQSLIDSIDLVGFAAAVKSIRKLNLSQGSKHQLSIIGSAISACPNPADVQNIEGVDLVSFKNNGLAIVHSASLSANDLLRTMNEMSSGHFYVVNTCQCDADGNPLGQTDQTENELNLEIKLTSYSAALKVQAELERFLRDVKNVNINPRRSPHGGSLCCTIQSATGVRKHLKVVDDVVRSIDPEGKVSVVPRFDGLDDSENIAMRSLRLRASLCLLPAAIVMTMAMTSHDKLPQILRREALPGVSLCNLVMLLLTTPIQWVWGIEIHQKAFKAFRRGRITMDSFISFNTTFCYVYSALLIVVGVLSAPSLKVPSYEAPFDQIPQTRSALWRPPSPIPLDAHIPSDKGTPNIVQSPSAIFSPGQLQSLGSGGLGVLPYGAPAHGEFGPGFAPSPIFYFPGQHLSGLAAGGPGVLPPPFADVGILPMPHFLRGADLPEQPPPKRVLLPVEAPPQAPPQPPLPPSGSLIGPWQDQPAPPMPPAPNNPAGGQLVFPPSPVWSPPFAETFGFIEGAKSPQTGHVPAYIDDLHEEAAWTDTPHYFETSALLITVVLWGRYFESVAKCKTVEELKRLNSFQRPEARLLRRVFFVRGNDLARQSPPDIPWGHPHFTAQRLAISGQDARSAVRNVALLQKSLGTTFGVQAPPKDLSMKSPSKEELLGQDFSDLGKCTPDFGSGQTARPLLKGDFDAAEGIDFRFEVFGSDEGVENEVEVEIVTMSSPLLESGDMVLVQPGEIVPADGILLNGSSSALTGSAATVVVDESLISGESLPVPKNEGDRLLEGSVVYSSPALCFVTATGQKTVLGQISSTVKDTAGSLSSQSGIIADKICSWFLPTALVFSILTWIVWAYLVYSGRVIPSNPHHHGVLPHDGGRVSLQWASDAMFVMKFGMSVLAIACPCALGLATPTAISVSTGRAMSFGVLVKNGRALELAGKARTIVLDKTGTLTVGKPNVVSVILNGTVIQKLQQKSDVAGDRANEGEEALTAQTLVPPSDSTLHTSEVASPLGGPEDLLNIGLPEAFGDTRFKVLGGSGSGVWKRFCQLVCILEKGDHHPLALALRSWAQNFSGDEDGACMDFDNLRTIPGVGRSGKFYPKSGVTSAKEQSVEGVQLNLGSMGFYERCCEALKKKMWQDECLEVKEWMRREPVGCSYVVLFDENGDALGMVKLLDEIVDRARESVELLHKWGYEVWICTGDNRGIAEKVGSEIGISSDHILSEIGPYDKRRFIEGLKRPNIMVGDGSNDSLALLASDVGISVNSTTSILTSASDVVLIKHDLSSILSFIHLSKKTRHCIGRNFVWAFIFNLIGMPAAAGLFWPYVELSPMFAGTAMACSSILVVLNSLLLMRVKPITELVSMRRSKATWMLAWMGRNVLSRSRRGSSGELLEVAGGFRRGG